MSEFYAPHWVWRLAYITGFLLLGYALATPVKLSLYFFAKPGVDIITDGLLIAGLVLIGFKWLKGKVPQLLLVIPILAICWLSIDFKLYSMSEWWSIISYLFLAAWAMSFTSCWYHFKERLPLPNHLLSLLLLMGLGFTIGLVFSQTWPGLLVACLFIIFLPYAGNSPDTGSRVVNEYAAILLLAAPLTISANLKKPVFYDSQKRHHDKVVFSQQTRFQTLDITEWKGNYWFYQDHINHYSSIDDWLYYEPFVHPVMQLAAGKRVLVIGGENGMLLKYLRSYQLSAIDLIPIDGEYLEIAGSEPLYTQLNEEVFSQDPINIIPADPFRWLSSAKGAYDVIFIDIPDPIDIELNQYYTREFYQLVNAALSNQGLVITQSGSPYFATAAFQSISKTIESAGFKAVSFHNQVLSLGEWAWTMGSKSDKSLKESLSHLTFEGIETQWLNSEAMRMMLSFGKPYVTVDKAAINTIENPMIYRLYNQGNYQLN